MKLNFGSIQRRGNILYLVTRLGGRSRWISLKTGDFNIAKKRARKLLPPEDSEQAWLEHLSRLGARADLELRRRSALASLTWRNLWDEFMARAAGTISEASETSYERWMRILAEAADELGLLPEDILKKDACAKITARLMGAYISARRMLVFYRRVWSTLGLDRGLWETSGAGTVKPLRRHEHYRRLSLEEIRKVHGYLQSRNRDLADMVVIGYSTGLRLSDVAWLEWSEIEADGRFLRVVPNKTHLTKPIPLKIPLTNQVRNLILRRRTSPPDGDPYLFSEDARHRPSRKIAAAFKSCGVFAHGNGRASFHSLRATFISMMDEAGVPPHITDSITGHAGGGMHARYTQPSPQTLLAAVKKAIPPL